MSYVKKSKHCVLLCSNFDFLNFFEKMEFVIGLFILAMWLPHNMRNLLSLKIMYYLKILNVERVSLLLSA